MRQFLIILGFSFLGELLKRILPLPVPASIYGLVLLFGALQLHIIKLDAVREAGRFFIEIMPLLFIPAGVGLIDSWGVLEPVWFPIAVIVTVSTIVVMTASGIVTQAAIRRKTSEGKRGDLE